MSSLSGRMARFLTKPFVANPKTSEEPQFEAPLSSLHILIIGYGNTLRGDDGIGWHAAEQLRTSLTRSDITITTCHQLTMELSEPISEATHLILIDASTGPEPGVIAMTQVEPDRALADSMHHHMLPAALLAYTEALYGVCPPSWLWTVTAAQYDFSEQLSPAVQRAMPELVDRIIQQTNSFQ